MKNSGQTWRIVLILSSIALMLYGTFRMVSSGSGLVDQGKVDLSSVDFQQSVALNGDWEFYWNRLLTPNDFRVAEGYTRARTNFSGGQSGFCQRRTSRRASLWIGTSLRAPKNDLPTSVWFQAYT